MAKTSGREATVKLAEQAPQDAFGRFVARRVAAATYSDGPNEAFMEVLTSLSLPAH